MAQPEQGTGQQVADPRAHIMLPDAVSYPAGPPVLVARAHRPEMLKIEARIVPAHRDPAEHPAAVAIDPIPHEFSDEAADLLETFGPIKLHHSDRILVPAHLHDLPPIELVVRLTAGRPDAWILLHPLDEVFEVRAW